MVRWNKWIPKKGEPYNEREILVKTKEGEICYAYNECNGWYHKLVYKVVETMINAYVVTCHFVEGDEWMYVESLKTEE